MWPRALANLAFLALCGSAAGAAAFRGMACVADRAALKDHFAQAERRRWLDAELRRANELYEFKRRLDDDVFAGRCGFTEAVDRLANSDFGQWRRLLDDLRRTYALDADRDCWAAGLIRDLMTQACENPERRRQWSPAWAAEYRANFRPARRAAWETTDLPDGISPQGR